MKKIQATQRQAVLLMVCSTIFISAGQLFWKYGMNSFSSSTINIPLLLGLVSYGGGAFLIVKAFQQGELSVLYPLIATSYVWVSLASPYLFPTDVLNPWKWTGMAFIVSSAALLGWTNSGKVHHD